MCDINACAFGEGEDGFGNFLAENRLRKAGTEEQFDYHLELMKRFRERQDRARPFQKPVWREAAGSVSNVVRLTTGTGTRLSALHAPPFC